MPPVLGKARRLSERQRATQGKRAACTQTDIKAKGLGRRLVTPAGVREDARANRRSHDDGHGTPQTELLGSVAGLEESIEEAGGAEAEWPWCSGAEYRR